MAGVAGVDIDADKSATLGCYRVCQVKPRAVECPKLWCIMKNSLHNAQYSKGAGGGQKKYSKKDTYFDVYYLQFDGFSQIITKQAHWSHYISRRKRIR